MSTDWKALAAELAAELERCRPLAEVPDCLARARAALAAEADGPAVQSREPASVVGEPSDEELLDLSQFHCLSYTTSDGSVISPYVEDTDMRSDVLSFARAAISRYGHQPAPPAEGDVAELVAALRADAECVEVEHYALCNMTADQMRRAADLLEQRHPTPVPVSERLPGPGDCDGEGRCWWFLPAQQLEILRQSDAWSLRKHTPRKDDYCRWTHWLPFNALPLPAGEVQP